MVTDANSLLTVSTCDPTGELPNVTETSTVCNTCVQAASNLKKDLVTRYRRLVYSNMYTMCTYLDVPQTGDGTVIH